MISLDIKCYSEFNGPLVSKEEAERIIKSLQIQIRQLRKEKAELVKKIDSPIES